MDYIKRILENESLSFEDLIKCLERVKQNGDIAVVKFDGERIENSYTVFISFPQIKNKEIIRVDESDLKIALIKVLKIYIREI